MTARSLEGRLRALAAGGVRFVQLRAKQDTAENRAALVGRLGPIAAALDVALVINDDLMAASLPIPGIWGVHLGQEDMRAAVATSVGRAALDELRSRGLGLGLSTHNLRQVEEAARVAPDYIGVGPIFTTRSKPDAEPVTGIETLAHACRRYDGPVVAIGGLDRSRLQEVRAAGAAAAAAISGLEATTPDECEPRARAWVRAWNHGV